MVCFGMLGASFLWIMGSLISKDPLIEAKPRIVYAYDALCGWCYGFGPVMKRFAEAHKHEFEVEVWSGGIHVGNQVTDVGQVSPYILSSYRGVENLAHVTFGESFLRNLVQQKARKWTSMPPAIALAIFREQHPQQALSFAAALQQFVYLQGRDLEDIDAYELLAKMHGYQGNDFGDKMRSQKYQAMAQQEFQQVEKWGIRGFPTVLMMYKGKITVLTQGFCTYEQLEHHYKAACKRMVKAQ